MKYDSEIHVRVTREERKFLEFVARYTPSRTLSEAVRLCINILRLLLVLEVIDLESLRLKISKLKVRDLNELLLPRGEDKEDT